jgi:hypothetical protein
MSHQEQAVIDAARRFADNEPIAWADGGHWHSCAVCNASLVVDEEDHEEDCVWVAICHALRELDRLHGGHAA